MMSSGWFAALVALFAWWFFTGAILWIVRQADRRGTGRRVTLILAPMALIGAFGVQASAQAATSSGAFVAFFSVLLIWGWIELAFLTGQVTGPNTYPCPEGISATERFLRAWGTIAYHEVALVAVLITLALTMREAANTVALWTFVVLFFARVSAKLNLYLGVPRINTEFIPRPLAHLPSHFRIRRLNWLFPVSVTLLSLAVFCWLERLLQADAAQVAGFAILSALTALALLEHWLMVLPLPDARLWRWMLPDAPAMDPSHTKQTTHITAREEQHGF